MLEHSWVFDAIHYDPVSQYGIHCRSDVIYYSSIIAAT